MAKKRKSARAKSVSFKMRYFVAPKGYGYSGGNDGNTFFCRCLKAHAEWLVVVNPSQFKMISMSSSKKKDKHDAKVLAKCLKKNILSEIRIKDDLRAKICQPQVRKVLVLLRTVLKNKVNNLLVANFIMLMGWEALTKIGLRKALSFHFGSITDTEIFVIVEQICSLNQNIEKLDKAIEDHGSKIDRFKKLKSIKGIVSKSLATLLSTIGESNDFRSSKQLTTYMGIVPRLSNSNNMVCHGRITKSDNKIVRTALNQYALTVKRYNLYLNAFYESVKYRLEGTKANIVWARNFLDIVY